jgi:hypothetical protein
MSAGSPVLDLKFSSTAKRHNIALLLTALLEPFYTHYKAETEKDYLHGSTTSCLVLRNTLESGTMVKVGKI